MSKDTRPYWEREEGWDTGGNCTRCGEAGRCQCEHLPKASEGVVWISDKQQDNYARRVFRANIARAGTSLAEAALRRRVPIVEMRDDRLLVPENWREFMKAAKSQREGMRA